MSLDEYPSIFSSQMEAIVFIAPRSARSRKCPDGVREIFCKQAGHRVGFLPGFVSLVAFNEFIAWLCFIC